MGNNLKLCLCFIGCHSVGWVLLVSRIERFVAQRKIAV